MRKPHTLFACLVPVVAMAVSAADGEAHTKLEPGVINIADADWSAPGDVSCYPQRVQTTGGPSLVIPVRRSGPPDFHFVTCETDGQSTADRIRSRREQSNAAIARHDVDGVLSLFDVEYQITTGSGALGHGAATERDAWNAEFARAADLRYVRTPTSIEVSTSGTRAAEVGTWTGSWSTPAGPRKSGGRYAAHWRLFDGAWKIRSELFVTLMCEGPGCS